MKKKHMNLNCLYIALMAVIVLLISACGDEKEVDTSQYHLNAPTGISATLLSNNTTVNLTWNAVPNASYYEINFRTNLDSADTRRYLTTTSVTQYSHNYNWWWINMTDVTTIYYYLKTHPISWSGYIASDWSPPVSVNIR